MTLFSLLMLFAFQCPSEGRLGQDWTLAQQHGRAFPLAVQMLLR